MIKVGMSVHESLTVADPAERRAVLDGVVQAGLDHVTVGDHVSFHGGTGFDGLTTATTALATNDSVHVVVGVYQLALRHPLPTMRQLASISEFAPGRLTLGVGVGGDDRREVSNCGVDPATRGRRLDEALALLRRLATGESVDHQGEFFELEGARITPAPAPAIPIVVGGAGDAAIRRTARFGDGWLGMFCSARRFGETRQRIEVAAATAGRDAPGWYGLTVWCGLDPDPDTARSLLGAELERLYRLPYDRFRNVTAAGTPAQVADWLTPFVAAGARNLTIVPAAASVRAAVDAVGEVRSHLLASFG